MTTSERERIADALRWAAGEAPDFAGLMPRVYQLAISKRRSRAFRWAAGAVAAAACVTVLGLLAVRYTGADVTVDPATSEAVLPTSDWKPGDDVMDGVLTGRLGVDDAGCPFVTDPLLASARKIRVLWPAGFTGGPDTSGRYAVRAADGTVVLTEGQAFSVAGGYVVGNDSPCLRGESRVFEANGLPEPR